MIIPRANGIRHVMPGGAVLVSMHYNGCDDETLRLAVEIAKVTKSRAR
jgi:hypothetical protein